MFLAVVFILLYFITWNVPAAIFLMIILTPELILLWIVVELIKRIFAK